LTQLRIEPYEIPAADLGPENPLPNFRGAEDDGVIAADPNLPEEDRRYLGWRTAFRVLPYRMQDGYNRDKRPRAFNSVVLENEFLRATVLPELGGRVVSLFHKIANRELLDRNPVFQPANLGLRNAWFCGGIEWNAGQLGHHYLTCSPVFAARVDGPGGCPTLRLYEWDRVKGFTWQVDLILPEASQFLFARVRIVNPHNHEIPMYWWTNIGVPERPDIRTLVPADTVLHHKPKGEIGVVDLPVTGEPDATYATNAAFAKEFFFRIPDEHRHWIASLDGAGTGLFQASTSRLRGRKMFMFGMNPGGRHWQEYLAVPGAAYLEIQAGLARTQIESVPMPAKARWEWTEAFGLLEADAAKVHSQDWSEAWRAAESALDARLPQSWLDNYHYEFGEVTAAAPKEILATGSGWAALERKRLAKSDQKDRVPKELRFDADTIGPDEAPWLALLEYGEFPKRDPEEGPGQMMIQPEWRAMLEDALAAGHGDHWLSWYHLGVMRMEARDTDGAREAWEKSIERKRTGWALRNLAVLEKRAERPEAACDLLRQAWEAGPRVAQLAVKFAQSLTQLKRFAEVAEFVELLPPEIAESERLRMLYAKARIETGRFEGVERFFEGEFATIREGEIVLSELWFQLHERRIAAAENVPVDDKLRARVRRDFPPPSDIDFRMGADTVKDDEPNGD